MAQTHETRFLLTAQDKTKVALKSAEDGFKGLDGVVTKLTAGFAGVASLGGIGLLVTKQVEAARTADNYSKALGVNVETLTAMQSAFQTVGIQSDKTADILKDVAEKIGDAFRNDAGEAKEALESLNLNIAQMAQLSPDQQLLAIADAMNQVGTQGEKVQIMEALASDASLLLPLLDNNAAKLRELTDAAIDSGAALTDIEVDTLKKAGAAMDDLQRASDALSQTLAVTLAPHLANLINFATDITKKFGQAETAVENFFDQLYSAGSDEAFTSLENARNDLDMMERRAARLREGIDEGGFGPNSSPARRLENLEKEIELQREKLRLAERQQELLDQYRAGGPLIIEITPGGIDTGAQGQGINDKEREKLEAEAEKFRQSLLTKEEILMEGHLRELAMIDQFEANKIETAMGYDEMRLQAALSYEQKMTQVSEQENTKRLQIEQAAQSQILALKSRVNAQAVGLLRTLGQEHEGAAYAAIALEKALAIGQINIEASKAHMAAYGLLSLGLAGPAAVAAMHTQIETSRAFAIGMTVASGLAEASNVSRGGGSISASGAPTPVTPVESPLTPPSANGIGPAAGNQITILIKGEGAFDDMVRNSIEVLSDNDELVFING